MKSNMLIVIIVASLLNIIMAQVQLYKYATVTINPGGYDKLTKEIRAYIESESESDTPTNKHIKVVDAENGEEVGTHKLEFIGIDGHVKETLLVDHVPVSMVKALIKEKKFVTSEILKDIEAKQA